MGADRNSVAAALEAKDAAFARFSEAQLALARAWVKRLEAEKATRRARAIHLAALDGCPVDTAARLTQADTEAAYLRALLKEEAAHAVEQRTSLAHEQARDGYLLAYSAYREASALEENNNGQP
jgi:hypothetical protein